MCWASCSGDDHVHSFSDCGKRRDPLPCCSKAGGEDVTGGARGARRRWQRLRANMRGRMPRSEESSLSPLHGSHFKEPQFQRVTPISRAVWLRYTDVERQTVSSSKGQLPTVTSQAGGNDSSGGRRCVKMLAVHRGICRLLKYTSSTSALTAVSPYRIYPQHLRHVKG